MFVIAAVLIFALTSCTFDPGGPKISGKFAEFLGYAGETGDGGFEPTRELTGAYNKFQAGWPAEITLTWKFDSPFGHKLPGER